MLYREKDVLGKCQNLGDLNLSLGEPHFLTDSHNILKNYQGLWIYDNLDIFVYLKELKNYTHLEKSCLRISA